MNLNMAGGLESIAAAFLATLGVVSALECFTCEWNSKNGTVEDNCVVAPYRVGVTECPATATGGMKNMCQTFSRFEVSGSDLHLIKLERKCALKHNKCNNLCSDESSDCWLCCNDNDKCNGFPLRTNVMVVSSATWQRITTDKLILISILLLFYHYNSVLSSGNQLYP